MSTSRCERASGSRCAIRLFVSLIALLTVAACSDNQAPPPLSPEDPETSRQGLSDGETLGWDLPLSSPGALDRAFPGRPCDTSAHRQFDFWVGEWNVYGPDGSTLFGTNTVTSELDGCLVQEHWTSSTGVRGRSLNTYDLETGMWHQDWVSQIPQAFIGRLRTSGGLEDGVMVLTGERDAVSGGTGFTFIDEWTWTSTPEGHVIQTGSAFAGPPFDQEVTDFTATYKRETTSPADEAATDFCQEGGPGGTTRDADFLVGSWDVSGDPGPSVGTSEVETDLRDCVFVESFESRGGLEAISFTYWDFWSSDWHRVYVDSQGERLALRGGFEGSSLVLEGTEATSSGDVEVRVIWTPDGSEMVQTWEVSRDGGAAWEETARLVYSPR
ncbi:MAG: hypothetical protein ACOC9H_01895 [Gemmatimonadota bacterium]